MASDNIPPFLVRKLGGNTENKGKSGKLGKNRENKGKIGEKKKSGTYLNRVINRPLIQKTCVVADRSRKATCLQRPLFDWISDRRGGGGDIFIHIRKLPMLLKEADSI